MADLLTITEHKGELKGLKLAFIGDGGNVARSLCLGLPAVGMSFTMAAPAEYNLGKASLTLAAAAGRRGRGRGHLPGGPHRGGQRGRCGVYRRLD